MKYNGMKYGAGTFYRNDRIAQINNGGGTVFSANNDGSFGTGSMRVEPRVAEAAFAFFENEDVSMISLADATRRSAAMSQGAANVAAAAAQARTAVARLGGGGSDNVLIDHARFGTQFLPTATLAENVQAVRARVEGFINRPVRVDRYGGAFVDVSIDRVPRGKSFTVIHRSVNTIAASGNSNATFALKSSEILIAVENFVGGSGLIDASERIIVEALAFEVSPGVLPSGRDFVDFGAQVRGLFDALSAVVGNEVHPLDGTSLLDLGDTGPFVGNGFALDWRPIAPYGFTKRGASSDNAEASQFGFLLTAANADVYGAAVGASSALSVNFHIRCRVA